MKRLILPLAAISILVQISCDNLNKKTKDTK